MPLPTRAILLVLTLLAGACESGAEQPPPPSTALDAARGEGTAPTADAAVPEVAPPDAAAVDAPADVAVTDTPGPEAAAPDAPPAGQIPPQGRRLLDPWLAAGHHKSWKCEAGPLNPRMGSPHGRVRICSNDLASRHGSGPYPVGAASVKEIYYGARIGVFAVSIKVAPGTGGRTWYWYEQNDMEGVGAPGCAGCHGRAGTDHVFIQVK